MFATVYKVTPEGVFVYFNDKACSIKKKFFHKNVVGEYWLQKGEKIAIKEGKVKRADFLNCDRCHKTFEGFVLGGNDCNCKEIKNLIFSSGVLIEKKHKLYKTGLGLKIVLEDQFGKRGHGVIFEDGALYEEFLEIPLGKRVTYKSSVGNENGNHMFLYNIFALVTNSNC